MHVKEKLFKTQAELKKEALAHQETRELSAKRLRQIRHLLDENLQERTEREFLQAQNMEMIGILRKMRDYDRYGLRRF